MPNLPTCTTPALAREKACSVRLVYEVVQEDAGLFLPFVEEGHAKKLRVDVDTARAVWNLLSVFGPVELVSSRNEAPA